MGFMDDVDIRNRPAVRVQSETDRRVDELFHGRPDEALPVLASPVGAQSATAPEFQMMMAMAQGRHRDHNALAKAAERIGERLGERAIYSFPVGGKRVEGPTVHLVEALAQEWGCLFYGTRIESIDGDRVVIMGICADAITGTVAARPAMFTLPPAPEKFARSEGQASRWESMQVQNAISKATRGVLQHTLPRWYIDAAYDAADRVRQGALQLKEGETFADAVGQVVAYYGKIGISVEGIEVFIGSPRALWVLSDVFALRKAAHDLKSGVLSREAFAVPMAEGAPAEGDGVKGRDAVRAAVKRTKAESKPPAVEKPAEVVQEPPSISEEEKAAILAAERHEAGDPDGGV